MRGITMKMVFLATESINYKCRWKWLGLSPPYIYMAWARVYMRACLILRRRHLGLLTKMLPQSIRSSGFPFSWVSSQLHEPWGRPTTVLPFE